LISRPLLFHRMMRRREDSRLFAEQLIATLAAE
jgi:hypothetical protein